MKHNYFLILTFAICNAFSQNLVPNPSFENFSACPNNQGQIQYATNWQANPSAWVNTPDFYNSCATGIMDVPANAVGNQSAFDGTGYAGLFVFQESSHEYMRATLTTPLTAGVDYEVSFYVSFADNFQLSTNNIGAVLSNNILSVPFAGYLDVTPHINSNAIISDLTGWTQISGTYHAMGGENYITIGNFYSNDETMISLTNPSADQSERSYYYIDMVSVIQSNLSDDKNLDNSTIVYPNPCKETLFLNFDNNANVTDIKIFNSLGVIVKSVSGAITNIDLSEFSSGIYTLMISSGSGKAFKKIIKI